MKENSDIWKDWKDWVVALIVTLVCSIVIFVAWNLLIPDIFGLQKITWLQATGLLVLYRSFK